MIDKIDREGDMERKKNTLGAVVHGISKFFFILSMAGTIFIGIMVFYNVFMRYIFRKPIFWTTEVTSLMLVFITFLGASYMIKEKKHIKFTLIYERLGGRSKVVVDIINSIAGIIFSIVLAWEAWKATKIAYMTNMRMPSLLGTPYYIPYFLITIGSFMVALEFFMRIFDKIMGQEE